MKTFEELRESIDRNGGALTVSMADLRDIVKAGRLGIHVRGEIDRRLAEERIGHTPSLLPSFQTALVRLYLVEAPVARIIEAVEDTSERSDQFLVKLAKAGKPVISGGTTRRKRRAVAREVVAA